MPGSELRVLKVLKILKEEITRVYAFLFWGRGGRGGRKTSFLAIIWKDDTQPIRWTANVLLDCQAVHVLCLGETKDIA